MEAIIIEDEVPTLNLLKSLIKDYCKDIVVIAEAQSISEGIEIINLNKPDLVFMDIELEGGKCFDLLDQLSFKNFYLIITTAYDQYALKAFEYEAIDYLLKPYSPKSIINAVNRILKLNTEKQVYYKLNKLMEIGNLKSKIALSTSKGIRYCKKDEILRLQASQSYCHVYLLTGEEILLSKPLAEIELSLPLETFCRVHRAHTVNCQYVKEVSNEDGGYVLLINDSKIPLARRRRIQLLEMLNL